MARNLMRTPVVQLVELLAVSHKRHTEVLGDTSEHAVETPHCGKVEIMAADGQCTDFILELVQGLFGDAT